MTWSGPCKNNHANGKGKRIWRWPGGASPYVGEMRGGKENGHGAWVSADGGRWEGNFVNGKLDGHGTFTNKAGDRYEGQWVKGKEQGHGTLTFANGDRYEGNFVNDKRTGHGTYVWPNGNRYVGGFRDGKEQGHGVFTWPNGARYDGQWVNGKETRGTYVWPNGDRYVGEFDGVNPHGHGVKTLADGTRQEGSWVHGGFVVQCGDTKFQNLTPDEGKALTYILERKQSLQGIACITELVATDKFPLRGQTVIKYRETVVFPNGYNTGCLNQKPQRSIEDGGFQGFLKHIDCSSSGMAPARPGEKRVFSGDEVI